MEFLVSAEIELPRDLADAEADALRTAESERARELAADGKLKRLWRVPGRWANRGLWEASDATELHELLTSLPLFPYMQVRIEPLARHPNDPAA